MFRMRTKEQKNAFKWTNMYYVLSDVPLWVCTAVIILAMPYYTLKLLGKQCRQLKINVRRLPVGYISTTCFYSGRRRRRRRTKST